MQTPTDPGTLRRIEATFPAENWPVPLRTIVERLLPGGPFATQCELLERAGVVGGGSALMLAPTGSGKSVVGIIAMLAAVARGRVGLMLCPTRALAAELHESIASAANGTGLAVALSTREHRADDFAIGAGDVDLVVAVYEKGLALLRAGGPLARRVGALVLDEIQIVNYAARGGTIEAGLTAYLHALADRPAIVAMSSCLEVPGAVSAWLGIPIVRSESRPVPLREGVLDVSTGRIAWSDGGEETFCEPAEEDIPFNFNVMREFSALGRRVILFVPTKRMAWEAATSLAGESVNKNNLSQAIMLVEDLDAGSRAALGHLVMKGVGVHTSELPAAARAGIETAFREGATRVLVATPTLAQGVNLRADVVLHWPEVAAQGGEFSGMSLVPITRAGFTNAGGRAGRPGGDAPEGWSLVLARGEAEARRTRAALFGPHAPNSCEPPLRRLTLEALCWLFPADGVGTSLELRRVIGAMMSGIQEVEVDLLLAEGVRLALWKTDAGSIYRLTGAGRAVARGGCRAVVASRSARLLWGAADDAAPFSLLLLACEGIPGWFPAEDRRMRVEESRAWRRIRSSRDAVGRARAGFDPPTLSAAHRAMIVESILGPDGPRGAGERHGLLGGTVEDLAAEAAWQLEILAGLAEHYKRPAVANLARRMSAALSREGPVPAPVPGPVAVSEPAGPRGGVRVEDHAAALEFVDAGMGLVRFAGREVRLPPLRFDFLLAVAGAGPAGISKNDLVARLWNAEPREEQQLFYHRRELERALLGREPAQPGELIETLPKWGFRLRVAPGEITGHVEAARMRPRAA